MNEGHLKSTDTWTDDVQKPFRRNYDSRRFFNADENGHFWRHLPEEIWLLKQRSAMEETIPKKECLWWFVQTWMALNSFPSWLLGSSRIYVVLKEFHFQCTTLPVQKSGWHLNSCKFYQRFCFYFCCTCTCIHNYMWCECLIQQTVMCMYRNSTGTCTWVYAVAELYSVIIMVTQNKYV